MRQFNLETDNGSPKTSQFTLPADEHFSILVRYRNWEDKREWLGYTLADQSGNDVVKYRMEQPDDGVLYFCSSISASQKLHFSNVSGESSYTPRDVIQLVALPSSTQDNCYICSADYARTAGEGGGGGGGVSQEYVDGKVQEEATARKNADEALSAAIPTKTSQLDNDSGFLTHEGTIANAENANTANTANTANSVAWGGVQSKPTTLDGYGITDAATKTELDSLAAVVGTANTQLEEIA